MNETKERKKKRVKQFFRVFFGRGIITKISLVIISIFILTAIFAPLLAQYDPTKIDPINKYLGLFSEGHPLGTDRFGRDVLSRLIYGARTSLVCSLLSTMWASIVGSTLGIIAGYFQGVPEKIITRLMDAQLAVPGLILSMTLATIFGKSIFAIAIVIGIGSIPGYTRMAYSTVLTLKENDFVVASRLVGQSKFKIMFKHLLPNCFSSLIVIFTMSLGNAIMVESGLAYLGVGLSEPIPAWGIMVSDGFQVLSTYPSLALLPGFCVMLIVIAFNVLGDSLRDAMDPKLRGRL